MIVVTGCYGGVRWSPSARAQANVWLQYGFELCKLIRVASWAIRASGQIDARLDSSGGHQVGRLRRWAG